jgi:hypothetical protein
MKMARETIGAGADVVLLAPLAAGLSGETPAAIKRGKSPPNFVLAGFDPAIHALGSLETKSWIRGSSPRKTI